MGRKGVTTEFGETYFKRHALPGDLDVLVMVKRLVGC